MKYNEYVMHVKLIPVLVMYVSRIDHDATSLCPLEFTVEGERAVVIFHAVF